MKKRKFHCSQSGEISVFCNFMIRKRANSRKETPMLRIALRVRLRAGPSAQGDTKCCRVRSILAFSCGRRGTAAEAVDEELQKPPSVPRFES